MSDLKVVPFKPRESDEQEITADEVLESAKGQFGNLVIAGYTDDDQLRYITTIGSKADLNILLDRVKFSLLLDEWA
jgi:hypothetical protein